MRWPSYYRLENQEYYFKKNILFHKKGSVESVVMNFDPSDYSDPDFKIVELLEYEKHLVFFLDYPTYRNIFCLNKKTDELVWRAQPPKAVWKTRKNYWCSIDRLENITDRVHASSVDGYRASIELETGNIVWEYDPDKSDPRDF